MELTNKKIMVTGGASGIGLGLTERFLQDGNRLIICGRRENALEAVRNQHPSVITRVCDLSIEAERIDLFNWIKENHPDLNVLVNNAGIQQWMQIDDTDFYTRAVEEINTNVLAPLHLTNLFLQLNKLEVIINITSGLAFSPLTKTPVYSATKAFFRSFTLSLRHLLKPRNITVIEMIPPALNTDLGGKGLHDGQPPVADFVEAVFRQMQEGKNELTFGFSEMASKASRDELNTAFQRMNP